MKIKLFVCKLKLYFSKMEKFPIYTSETFEALKVDKSISAKVWTFETPKGSWIQLLKFQRNAEQMAAFPQNEKPFNPLWRAVTSSGKTYRLAPKFTMFCLAALTPCFGMMYRFHNDMNRVREANKHDEENWKKYRKGYNEGEKDAYERTLPKGMTVWELKQYHDLILALHAKSKLQQQEEEAQKQSAKLQEQLTSLKKLLE
jgi:hypothetical protein